jgi:hypothetical protein
MTFEFVGDSSRPFDRLVETSMFDLQKAFTCPVCSSHRIVRGTVSGPSQSVRGGMRFFPDDIRMLTLQRAVPVAGGERFFGCLDCNLIWAHAPAGALKQLIANSATPELMRRIGPLEDEE